MNTNHEAICPHCGGPVPEDSVWYVARIERYCCSADCGRKAAMGA